MASNTSVHNSSSGIQSYKSQRSIGDFHRARHPNKWVDTLTLQNQYAVMLAMLLTALIWAKYYNGSMLSDWWSKGTKRLVSGPPAQWSDATKTDLRSCRCRWRRTMTMGSLKNKGSGLMWPLYECITIPHLRNYNFAKENILKILRTKLDVALLKWSIYKH